MRAASANLHATHGRLRSSTGLIIAILLFGCSGAVPAVQRYVAVPLGTFGGTNSEGFGINSLGEVTGTATLPGDTKFRAFVFRNGTLVDLGMGDNSVGHGINRRGDVTGGGSIPYTSTPWILRGSTGIVERPLPSSGYGTGINERGDVAIQVDDGAFGFRCGGRYVGGVYEQLFPSCGPGSEAHAINVFGDVAGWAGGFARFWPIGTGSQPGEVLSAGGIVIEGPARATNAARWVTGGTWGGPPSPGKPFIYYDGLLAYWDMPGLGLGINASNEVGGGGSTRAFLISGWHSYYLDNLVVSGLGGKQLTAARAINDRGQIVANSCAFDGFISSYRGLTCSAFRLDPIVEPPALPLDLAALGRQGLAWRNTSTGQTAAWLMNGLSASDGSVLFQGDWTIVGTADFDSDGHADLLWRNPSNASYAIWLMNGLTGVLSGLVPAQSAAMVTHLGEFSGDGKADLVLYEPSIGATYLRLMNGIDTNSSAPIFQHPNWRVSHVADLDGDGKSDLLWRNAVTGETAAWLMDGLGIVGSDTLFADPAWQVVRAADVDGDGSADLVWRNASTGATALWLMQGLSSKQAAIVFGSAAWSVAGTGDFNGDGKADLLWKNNDDGSTAIWLMNGTSTLAAAVVESDPAWKVMRITDLDGDGKSDLVWRNMSTGATRAWLMNGVAASAQGTLLTDPNWVVLDPMAP